MRILVGIPDLDVSTIRLRPRPPPRIHLDWRLELLASTRDRRLGSCAARAEPPFRRTLLAPLIRAAGAPCLVPDASQGWSGEVQAVDSPEHAYAWLAVPRAHHQLPMTVSVEIRWWDRGERRAARSG